MSKRCRASEPRLYLNKNNRAQGKKIARETAPSCSRYCSNVCRVLFPFNFNSCFNDCLSCQNELVFETDHEFYEE